MGMQNEWVIDGNEKNVIEIKSIETVKILNSNVKDNET